jgi:hypothetical protein
MKEIPYIHCFNHKLHLVVMSAVSECSQVADYYTICGKLYTFFGKPNVATVYEGGKLKRLLEHRWTGHLMTTRTVLNNYEDILEVLKLCANRNSQFSADTQVDAVGLLVRVDDVEFRFITELMHLLLTILESANAILQGAAMDLCAACDIVETVGERIRALRTEEEFIAFFEKFEVDIQVQPEPKRRRIQMNTLLADFVVMSSVGHKNDSTLPKSSAYKQIFFGVIDRIVEELSNRFNHSNRQLFQSLAA